LPTEAANNNAQKMLEEVLDHYKQNLTEIKLEKHENIARAMARNMSVKAGKELSNQEMSNLIDSLFACDQPYSSPFGKPSLISITLEELEKRFKN
jgi:DNA mismatch repair protein MutL